MKPYYEQEQIELDEAAVEEMASEILAESTAELHAQLLKNPRLVYSQHIQDRLLVLVTQAKEQAAEQWEQDFRRNREFDDGDMQSDQDAEEVSA